MVSFMPQKRRSQPLASRLRDIRDVASDLTRELSRVRRVAAPANAVHDMAAFIQTEVEAALLTLDQPRLPATRRQYGTPGEAGTRTPPPLRHSARDRKSPCRKCASPHKVVTHADNVAQTVNGRDGDGHSAGGRTFPK
jgi:hypothetical protein